MSQPTGMLSGLVSIMAASGKGSWTGWLMRWVIAVSLISGVETIITLAGGFDRETAVNIVLLLAGVALLLRLVDRLVWRITKSRRGPDDMRQAP